VFDGTLVKLIKFPAEHLTIFHGTLVFRGTPVENHCLRLKKIRKKSIRFITEDRGVPKSAGPVAIAAFATTVNRTLVLHSLDALPVAILAVPANSTARANNAQNAKHIVDYLMCSFKHAHMCINTNAKMCLKALCSKK